MSFCAKCGAYIPMEETACPACGYDPEAERKAAAEAAARQAAEQTKAEEERNRAAAEAERRAEEQRKAQESAERARQQAKEWAERAKEQLHNASQQKGQWTAPWSSGSAAQAQNASSGSYNAASQSGSYSQTGSYTQNANSTPNRQSITRNSRLSVLSYFGFLFLVPLIMQSNDPFARFHANQGLLLFLFGAAVNIVADIIPLGGLTAIAGGLVTILCIIRGVRSVLAGRMDKLPIIGDWRLIR